MKLIRCHIENFGRLSDFDFEFSESVTAICQNNGFGKTTFAAFIKAMLYGLPRTGARSVVENERKRYDPWQGGQYGGFLEFEIDGCTYRVTRYFGKTAAKDRFSFYDLTHHQESARFSEKLGKELFGLDADSFSRSIFIPQLSLANLESTSSIRTKLSNLVDDTNDLNNYDTAEKKLKEERGKYRAYRGSGGSINELERRGNELDALLFQAKQERPQLEEASRKIEILLEEEKKNQQKLESLRNKIRIMSELKSRQMLQKQFKEFQTNIEKNQQYLEKQDVKYAAGYPSLEEIRAQRENIGKIRQERDYLREIKLSEKDKDPSEETEKIILNKKKARSEGQSLPEKETSKKPVFCLILGIFLLAFGLFSFMRHMPIPGIFLLVAGFLAFLLAFWLRTKEMLEKAQNQKSRERLVKEIAEEEKQKLYDLQEKNKAFYLRIQEEANKAKAELREFLSKYRLSREGAESWEIFFDLLEEDIRNQKRVEEALAEEQKNFDQFLQENSEVKSWPLSEEEQLNTDLNSEELKRKEKELLRQMDENTIFLRQLRQQVDRHRQAVENIPQWEDELARIESRCEEEKEKCALLDHTLLLLEQAKNNLANSYIGKLEGGFEKYANVLLADQLGQARVNKDLKLWIDEKGAAREVGSFSAGMMDTISLCMRLALVDALFEKEKPFLIMDDPFVNLDDEHTREALHLLAKIGETYQIVYLTCNSSRI
jgi:DNA repair exonuclease SbcCD ATPase subunit